MAEIGRPTVMTPETIAKLEEGFISGLSDREACLYANINPATLYRFCEENPDFSERKELLKEQVKMNAKFNVATGIKAGDKPLSTWYLERRDKAFNPKQEVEHSGNVVINLQTYGANDSLSMATGKAPITDSSDQKSVQSDSLAPESA